MELPIRVVHGTSPPVFEWRQAIAHQYVTHRSTVMPTIEDSLVELIRVTKRLVFENVALQGRVDALTKQLEDETKVDDRKPTQQPIKKGK